MNRGDGFPTTTGTGSTTNRIITGPGCRGDSTTGIRGGVNFYFGGGYVGWAPWGHYGGHGRNVTNVVINQTIINRWNPRDPGNGLNVVRERDFGRGSRLDRRVTPTRAIASGFRQGLPGELQNPVRGERSVQARGRVSRSANAFRSRSVSPIRSGTDPAAAPSRRGTASTRSSFSSTPTSRTATGRDSSPRVFRGDEPQQGGSSARSRRGPNVINVGPSRARADRPETGSRVGSSASPGRQTRVAPSTPGVQPEESPIGKVSRTATRRPKQSKSLFFVGSAELSDSFQSESVEATI